MSTKTQLDLHGDAFDLGPAPKKAKAPKSVELPAVKTKAPAARTKAVAKPAAKAKTPKVKAAEVKAVKAVAKKVVAKTAATRKARVSEAAQAMIDKFTKNLLKITKRISGQRNVTVEAAGGHVVMTLDETLIGEKQAIRAEVKALMPTEFRMGAFNRVTADEEGGNRCYHIEFVVTE